ncbi:MAG: aspartate aminotransferase family protein, partial [bacterium]|nr:aspartate aminotransferase family protein [bacterium]
MAEDFTSTFRRAFERAVAYRERAASVPPRPTASVAELRAAFDIGLPEEARDGVEIIETLANAGERGLIGITSPNFFGWVMGASHPVAAAAEFLVAAWGQNAAIYQTAPAAAAAEEVAGGWLLELLDLPSESSVGFTTGATMASFICLSAARTEVLCQAGWDLEQEGLIGAPEVHVFLGEEAHATIHSALRYLGFGERQKVFIDVDAQGRTCVDDLRAKLETRQGPKIIISQAGHINSGAFDPLPEIVQLAKAHEAWLHVDGAFGLWVRCVPSMAHLCPGAEGADSWSVDGHKWLQVPYDSGFAIVKNEIAHKRAMDTSASYISATVDDGRSPSQFGPELSRRARGFAVWATIQALGRQGIEEMVRRHCRCARHLRDSLAGEPGIEVLNDVVINQVAIGFGEESEDLAVRDG